MNVRTALLCCLLALCLAPLAGADEAAPLPGAAAAPTVTDACPADAAADAAAAWLGGAAAPLARTICSATFCEDRRKECFNGCPCALFECKPASCSYICSCPIICLEES